MGVVDAMANKYESNAESQAVLDQGYFQLSEARQNKYIYDYLARDAEARAANRAAVARMRGSELEGAQKTAYASSGVDPGKGTPMQVMLDTRLMTELDAQTIKNNAAREAWGFKVRGQLALEQGQYSDAAAKAKSSAMDTSSSISAAGAIMTVGMGGSGGSTSQPGTLTAANGQNSGLGYGDFGGNGGAYGYG